MIRMIRLKRPTARRAFTILELLIVIGILLAIGGLVLYNVLGASEKADVKLAKVQIQGFERALEAFKLDLKRWPTEDEGLVVLWDSSRLENDDDRTKWSGPYLKEAKTKDTWGNEWVYRAPSTLREGAGFDIVSFGPDRQEGTDDDLTNQQDREAASGDEFSDFSGGGAGGPGAGSGSGSGGG